MIVSGTVIGFDHDSALISFCLNGRHFHSFLNGYEISAARIPVQLKVKLGDELILDACSDSTLLHRTLLPTFADQIEFLQLSRHDSVEAVVRFANSAGAAGAVVEVSSNLYGFVYNFSAPIGQKVLFGVKKIDLITERLVGTVEHVYFDTPLQTEFPIVYRDEILNEFKKISRVAA